MVKNMQLILKIIIPADIKPVKVVYEKTKGEEYDKQEIMERI